MTKVNTGLLSPYASRSEESGTRAFNPNERRVLDRVVERNAHDLRRVANLLGGLIEHYSECDCGQENSDHDALILVIPEPYLSAYRKHWPEFQTALNLEVEAQQFALDQKGADLND